MIDLDKEAQQARRQFFLTAGAVVCFLFLPILFVPLFHVIPNRALQILLGQLIPHGGTILFIALYSRKYEPEKPLFQRLNLQQTPACNPLNVLKLFFFMFLLTSAATMLVQTVSNLLSLNLPEQNVMREALNGTWWQFAVIAFCSLILAPVAEELLFRGALFQAFSKILGKNGAMTGVALLFALLHWNVLTFLSLFLMGIMLQKAVEKTGTLRTAIWMHFLNNLISVLYLLVIKIAGLNI